MTTADLVAPRHSRQTPSSSRCSVLTQACLHEPAGLSRAAESRRRTRAALATPVTDRVRLIGAQRDRQDRPLPRLSETSALGVVLDALFDLRGRWFGDADTIRRIFGHAGVRRHQAQQSLRTSQQAAKTGKQLANFWPPQQARCKSTRLDAFSPSASSSERLERLTAAHAGDHLGERRGRDVAPYDGAAARGAQHRRAGSDCAL